jgi:hypothetical protein
MDMKSILQVAMELRLKGQEWSFSYFFKTCMLLLQYL